MTLLIKMEEVYRRLQIDGRDTNYEVSNKGNVRNTLKDFVLKQGTRNEYRQVTLSVRNIKERHKVHRLVAIVFLPNPYDKPFVDHIDGTRSNNNVENLRWATNSENQINTKLSPKNTSGVRGVSWDKQDKIWRASIKVDGITINIGRYHNIEDAQAARIERVNKIFREYVHPTEKHN